MKLLAHLIAADVRRFRGLIAVWVAIVLADALVDAMRPLSADPGFSQALMLMAELLGVARGLFLVLLVPLVVHAHPAVGSDAFWMTRPVPPRSLLLSKLILLSTLLIVLPLLRDLTFMGISRVPVREMALVAVQGSLLRALYLTVLICAAAITPNLARFAILCGAALLSLTLVIAVTARIAISDIDDIAIDRAPFSNGGHLLPIVWGPDMTPFVVGSLLMIVAGFALLVVQYSGRSLRRSVTFGLAGVIGAWLVAEVWPWPLFQPRLEIPAWAQSPPALTLAADRATGGVDSAAGWSDRPRRWRTVRARVWLSGVDPSWVATARLARATLDLGGGARLVSRGHYHSASVPSGEENMPPLRRTFRNVLGVRRLIESGPPRGEMPVVFVLREDDFERHRSKTGTYQGQFLIGLSHVSIAAILPVERGAKYQHGAYRFRIDAFHQQAAGLTVRARISNVSTMFDRRPRPTYFYYLRNQRRSEAAAGLQRPFFEDDFFLRLFGVHGSADTSGFTSGATVIRFPEAHGNTEALIEIDSAWLADAELVIVRMTGEGSVPRALEFDGLPLLERRPSSDGQSGGLIP